MSGSTPPAISKTATPIGTGPIKSGARPSISNTKWICSYSANNGLSSSIPSSTNLKQGALLVPARHPQGSDLSDNAAQNYQLFLGMLQRTFSILFGDPSQQCL